MQKQVIKFTNRSPYPNSIFIGNEDDNLARRVQFVLPSEIDGAKIYLHLSIGEYSDVIELDDSLIYVPTRTHTQYPGNWTGYLEAHADNDTVWHSNTFTFKVGDLPDSGEQIEQAYPSVIESALNEIRSLSRKTEDNAEQVSKDKQAVEQKVLDINASTSKINIVAQTLEPGTTATADASISPKDGIQLNVGIPGGLPGRDGRDGVDGVDGKDGYTPVKGVDYFDGVNGLNAPQIDDTQASAEHPWSGEKVNTVLIGLKDDLADNAKSDAETRRKLDYLWKLNQGISYQFETDVTEAYSKTVPSGAKLASVKSIGGHTEAIDGDLVSADVESVKYNDTVVAEIPGIVRTFPGYGWSAGKVCNAIERTDTGWQYVQPVSYTHLTLPTKA